MGSTWASSFQESLVVQRLVYSQSVRLHGFVCEQDAVEEAVAAATEGDAEVAKCLQLPCSMLRAHCSVCCRGTYHTNVYFMVRLQ